MNNLTISEKQLVKCFDRPSIRLKIKAKTKSPVNYNWVNFYEALTISQILEKGYNWGIRTGKQIGSYYLVIIDLDDKWAKVRMSESCYVQTAKGIHVYLLIKELPNNKWLVNKNNDKIGELHSYGRFVVGFGSTHSTGIRYSLKGRNNLKWFIKLENLSELEQFLASKNIFLKPWGWKKL